MFINQKSFWRGRSPGCRLTMITQSAENGKYRFPGDPCRDSKHGLRTLIALRGGDGGPGPVAVHLTYGHKFLIEGKLGRQCPP